MGAWRRPRHGVCFLRRAAFWYRDGVPRTTRQLALADHLWDAYGRMAEEMGSDREALVNEAMHFYARLHGFVMPGTSAADAAEPLAADSRERRAVAERVLETAERLERDLAARPPPVPAPGSGLRAGLRLQREDGSTLEIAKDRFVIGRGGHCDLVIESPKVSREHATFVRGEDGWWIEDLGSSNGTWFRGERITRRKVEHGDEYFVSAERLRCTLR